MSTLARPNRKKAMNIAVLLAVFAGLFLVSPYFTVIAFSAIAAYVFYPVFDRINRKIQKPGTSSALTTLLVLITVILPVGLLVVATFNEAQKGFASLSQYADGRDITAISEDALTQLNAFLEQTTNGAVQISIDQVRDGINTAASKAADIGLSILSSALGGIGAAITAIVLFLYIFSSLLIHHRKLFQVFRGLNPLGDDVADIYLAKAGAMTKAMVGGQFVIAACQGLVSALILYIAGIELFWLMALLLTVLSIIPLGAGIITIPIGIVLMLAGNVWQGALVLLGHFLLVTNIDNVLRPMLVPKSAQLNSALTMLSVFSGIYLFGLLGIVIGPVLMILIVTTFQIYIEETTQTTARRKSAKA